MNQIGTRTLRISHCGIPTKVAIVRRCGIHVYTPNQWRLNSLEKIMAHHAQNHGQMQFIFLPEGIIVYADAI